MISSGDKFPNVILCEDVREEVGGKFSLMGVFGGHVIVPTFPATLQFASFVQYRLDPEEPAEVDFQISIFQDEINLVSATLQGQVNSSDELITLLLPKALIIFDKPASYRIVVTARGEEYEVMSKKVLFGDMATRSTAPWPSSEQSPPAAPES